MRHVTAARIVAVLAILATFADAMPAQQQAQLPAQPPVGPIPFDAGWQLSGDSARIEDFDGRTTFTVRSGFAFRRDVRLRDGTIDFDVWTT